MRDLHFPQITFTIFGRWIRLYAGITFKPKILRNQRFDDHHLWAIRLWPIRHPDYTHNWRIIGFQTRPAYETDKRFRAWT